MAKHWDSFLSDCMYGTWVSIAYICVVQGSAPEQIWQQIHMKMSMACRKGTETYKFTSFSSRAWLWLFLRADWCVAILKPFQYKMSWTGSMQYQIHLPISCRDFGSSSAGMWEAILINIISIYALQQACTHWITLDISQDILKTKISTL